MYSISSIFQRFFAPRMSDEERAFDLTQRILSKNKFDKAAATKLLRLCGHGKNETLNHFLLQVERKFSSDLLPLIAKHGSKSLCDALEDTKIQRLEKYGVGDCTVRDLYKYSERNDPIGKAACKELIARLYDPDHNQDIAMNLSSLYMRASNFVDEFESKLHVVKNLEEAALQILLEESPETSKNYNANDAHRVFFMTVAPHLQFEDQEILKKHIFTERKENKYTPHVNEDKIYNKEEDKKQYINMKSNPLKNINIIEK